VTRDVSSPPWAPLWLRRLRSGFARPTHRSPIPDPLRSAGQSLRDAREAKGLRLRDLAQGTRISIAVLEALEGGWKDRLPEATYLRSMLPLLEKRLDLPKGSLDAVLPHAGRRARGAGLPGATGGPFSLSALQQLASWQSTLAYGLLVLGLIYALNLQQRRLAAMGRLETGPISFDPAPTAADNGERDPFPDLHPLKVAARGQAMALLARETLRGGPDLTLGVLHLRLTQPTQLELRGPRGGQTQLRGLEGELSLPVLPPFELRLTPTPAPTAVRWKGNVLAPKAPSPSAQGGDIRQSSASYVVPVSPASPQAPPPPHQPHQPDPADRGGPSPRTP
jgi:hypothetical protein